MVNRYETATLDLANKYAIILVDIVCAPPAIFIRDFISSKSAHVQVAGQNCYHAKEGAFIGEIR